MARLGGDEFAILLMELSHANDCFILLQRILSIVNQPMLLNDSITLLQISASIGVTIFPQDNYDPDTLLRHADQAMYQAKQSGRNRFHVYDLELDKRLQNQQVALKEIEQALISNEFLLYYQPKVELQTGDIIGAEALIRWQHPEKGLLTPIHFLPVIENTELEYKIGNWVIDTALMQLEQWHLAGLEVAVSINIAGDHLQHANFVEKLQSSLQRHPALPSGYLQIEILETIALKDFDRATKAMTACQQLGISFALDDFGTGYSSLTYLRNLPAEIIKIDQSFVRDMLEDDGDRAIVQGVLALTDIQLRP